MEITTAFFILVCAVPFLVGLVVLVLLKARQHARLGTLIAIILTALMDCLPLAVVESFFISASRDCGDAISRGAASICGEYDFIVIFGLPIIIFTIGAIQAVILLAIAFQIARRKSSSTSRLARVRRRTVLLTAAVPLSLWATIWIGYLVYTNLDKAPTVPQSTIAVSTTPLQERPAPKPSSPITIENVDQIKQLARWGRGRTIDATWSADGKLLAVATTIGLYLYDANTFQERLFIEAEMQSRGFAFSPDGKWVAIGTNKTVTLWDTSDGHLLRSIPNSVPPAWLITLTFSSDGSQVIVARSDVLRMFDAASGSLVTEFRPAIADWDVSKVTFSADRKMLAVSVLDAIKLFDIDTRQSVRTMTPAKDYYTGAVELSPDGKILVEGHGPQVKLWNTSNGQETRTLGAHTSGVDSVAFSGNGKLIASSANDKTVRLWDSVTGESLGVIKEVHFGSMPFSVDGNRLATLTTSGEIRIWDTASAREVRTLSGFSEGVESGTFSPDGAFLALAMEDRSVQLWSVTDASGRRLPKGTPRQIVGCAITRGGPPHPVSIAFSLDGNTVVAGLRDGTIDVWTMPQLAAPKEITGHRNVVYGVALSEDGRTLISGSCDKTIKLWDVQTGREISSVTRDSAVTMIALSPDGKTAVSGDNHISLWSVTDSGLAPLPCCDRLGMPKQVTFSPDGKLLGLAGSESSYNSSDEKTVRLVVIEQGSVTRTLASYAGAVTSVAFSRDGKLVASADKAPEIILWEVATGRELRTISLTTRDDASVTFSPDGNWLVVISTDGTVRFFGVQ